LAELPAIINTLAYIKKGFVTTAQKSYFSLFTASLVTFLYFPNPGNTHKGERFRTLYLHVLLAIRISFLTFEKQLGGQGRLAGAHKKRLWRPFENHL